MRLSQMAPVKDFPVVKPLWHHPSLYVLFALAQLPLIWTVMTLWAISDLPLEGVFRVPVIQMLLVLGELVCLGFTWLKASAYAGDQFQEACSRWYLQHPRHFLQQLDGQVAGGRILKASELDLVSLTFNQQGFHAHCLNRQEQLLHIVASHRGKLKLIKVEMLSPTATKTFLLNNNQQAYLRLHGTPEHW